MRREEETTYIDSNEVLQRLAHLQTLDMQMSSMEEVINPSLAIMVRLSKISSTPPSPPSALETVTSAPQIAPSRYRDAGTRDRSHPSVYPCYLQTRRTP